MGKPSNASIKEFQSEHNCKQCPRRIRTSGGWFTRFPVLATFTVSIYLLLFLVTFTVSISFSFLQSVLVDSVPPLDLPCIIWWLGHFRIGVRAMVILEGTVLS